MKELISAILLLFTVSQITFCLQTNKNTEIRQFQTADNGKLIQVYLLGGDLFVIYAAVSQVSQVSFTVFFSLFTDQEIAALSDGILESCQQVFEMVTKGERILRVSPQGNIQINYEIMLSGVPKKRFFVLPMKEKANKSQYEQFISEKIELRKQINYLKGKIEQKKAQDQVEKFVRQAEAKSKPTKRNQEQKPDNLNFTYNKKSFFLMIKEKYFEFFANFIAKASDLYNEDMFDQWKKYTKRLFQQSGKTIQGKAKQWTDQATEFAKNSGKKISKKAEQIAGKVEQGFKKLKNWFTK